MNILCYPIYYSILYFSYKIKKAKLFTTEMMKLI